MPRSPTAPFARGRSHARHERGRGRAGRGAGDDVPERPAPEAAVRVHVDAQGRRAQQSARSCRMRRSAGTASRSRGARRDAGTGRPRQVADPRHLRDGAGGRLLRRGQDARPISPTACWASRPRSRSATRRRRCGGAVQGRPELPNAAPQPQCHRAARRDRGVGGRRASRARRHPDGQRHRLDAGAGVRARRRTRCASCRPSLAAGSAARPLGPPCAGGRGRPGSPAVPCGSCCRAKACSGSSVGARPPSSASRSAPRRTARLRR